MSSEKAAQEAEDAEDERTMEAVVAAGVDGPVVDDEEEVQVLEARRKFFPRIKTLLSEEYADFLKSVIEALEDSNCASFSTATTDTPWSMAFDAIYGGVARDYSVPVGKNRLHKFKSKMVELWTAMDREVKVGNNNVTDPVYKMALKQFEVHMSILPDRPSKSNKETVVVRLSGEDNGDGTGGIDPSNPFTNHQSHSYHHVASTTAESHSRPRITKKSPFIAMPAELADSLRHSVSRMEQMFSTSGLVPPKLPSPLNELLRIKDQIGLSEFRRLVEPTYEREVVRHLEVVLTQAHNSAHPGLLPAILDGIDTLKRVPGQRPTIVRSIEQAYTRILKIYINLLGSSKQAGVVPTSTTAAADGSRKAPPASALSEEGPAAAKKQKVNDDDEAGQEQQQHQDPNVFAEDDAPKEATSV